MGRSDREVGNCENSCWPNASGAGASLTDFDIEAKPVESPCICFEHADAIEEPLADILSYGPRSFVLLN